MMVNCPKCGADISDTYEPDDYSVGIVGGWFCDACDLPVGEDEIDRHCDDDVFIGPSPKREDGKIGTPLSELSGRPGEPGYADFCRIAASWGFD